MKCNYCGKQGDSEVCEVCHNTLFWEEVYKTLPNKNMKVYRCPNGCSVSDEYKRCAKCGVWLKYDGKHELDDIEQKSRDISMENLPSQVHLPKK